MIHLLNKNKLAWRIRATFAGKLSPNEYITPDIRSTNPGWGDEIFNRTIEKLEFFIPTGHRLVMAGMEKYNFFIEAVQVMVKAKTNIEAFYFCGKIPGQNVVEVYRIKSGEIARYRSYWGREYNGKSTSGWKRGLGGQAIARIII